MKEKVRAEGEERAACFRRSMTLGLLDEGVGYGLMLLCGYLLSELLGLTMEGLWDKMYQRGLLTGAALILAIVPKFILAYQRSVANLADTQRYRNVFYDGVINRNIRVDDCGEMEVRLNSDVNTVAEFFEKTCPKAVSGIVIMLCSAVLLCLADMRIGLIFFCLNFLQLLPLLVYEKWARNIYRQTHSDEEEYCNWLLEGYKGINTIKAYGLEKWYMKRFYRLNDTIIRSGKRAEQTGAVENIVFASVDSLLNYGGYVMIGLFVLFGGLSVEKTPLIIILSGYLFSSISSVFDWRLQQFDYQEASGRLEWRKRRESFAEGEAVLAVSGVIKAFGEKQVLRGASLQIKEGERVLLNGENGSGKSTLLRIIAGLEEADGGETGFGLPRDLWAISLQEEPELSVSGRELADTLRRTGCVDGEAFERHVRGFGIKELLDRPLSELSQGERKKFYLASVLARPSRMLILDEPTNHLDQNSVHYLMEQLRTYDGTLLVCTHAVSIPVQWNRILRMEGGVCHEA